MSGGMTRGVEIKMCGIRSLEQARAAIQAGADYVGFVFAAGRRQVTPRLAREIVRALDRDGTRFVGVFVNPDPLWARSVATQVGLDIVQLSGQETPAEVEAIGLPVFKAVHVGPFSDPLEEAERFAEAAEIILLDTHDKDRAGGTGRAFDWSLAKQASRSFPVMLAGGLTAANVGTAVRSVRPKVVDVSSGIETGGVKDPDKIAAFAEAVGKIMS